MLDSRHPIVRKHVTEVLEKMHLAWQFDMVKIDNNIELASGTTVNASTPGFGLAVHRKAYFEWLNNFMQAHTHIVLNAHCDIPSEQRGVLLSFNIRQ